MRNRSFLTLPSFYVHAEPSRLDERSAEAGPLEVFDITYLHFHSVLELGVCASGRGTCVVEGENMPFAADHLSLPAPFVPKRGRRIQPLDLDELQPLAAAQWLGRAGASKA